MSKQATVPQHTAPRLKIIVRRLPPHLPENVFWQSVEPWVSDDSVSWKKFCPGKLRSRDRLYKEDIPARAYIQFKNLEQIAAFSKEYDGHVFRDKQGRESYAVVEFAPYQKVPPIKERIKADQRNNTIEKDEDYKSFIQYLSESPAPNPQPTTSAPSEEPKLTPLLEALIAEKTILKAKDRSHAESRHNSAKGHSHAEGKSKGGKGASAPTPTQSKDIQMKATDKGGRSNTDGDAPGHGKGKRGAKGKKEAAQVQAQVQDGNVALPQGRQKGLDVGGAKSASSQSTARNLPTKTTPSASAPANPNSGAVETSKPSRKERERERRKVREAAASNANQAATPGSVTVMAKPQTPASGTALAPKKSDQPASVTITRSGSGDAAPPSTQSTGTSGTGTEPIRPRRGRPMLGLGSRQFTAALNHAGVANPGGGGVGASLKEPREKNPQGGT